MDENILFGDLLGLSNQSLLERLDLLNHLISLWISALEFPPPVHIEWLLKLIVEELGLLLLLKILLLEQVDLPLEVRDACCLELGDDQLSFELRDILSNVQDIIQLLLIVDLSLLEC